MKDWYEELARLVGRAMADEWMKIIARQKATADGKPAKIPETDRAGMKTHLNPDREERNGKQAD